MLLRKQGTASPQARDSVAEDKTLGDRIVDTLAGHPAFSAFALGCQGKVIPGKVMALAPEGGEGFIGVRVARGVVSLTGDVPSPRHHAMAERLCRAVPGCADVVNQLAIEEARGHA